MRAGACFQSAVLLGADCRGRHRTPANNDTACDLVLKGTRSTIIANQEWYQLGLGPCSSLLWGRVGIRLWLGLGQGLVGILSTHAFHT